METRINCPLTEMQTFWYRRLLLRDSSVLLSEEVGGKPAVSKQFKANADGNGGEGESEDEGEDEGEARTSDSPLAQACGSSAVAKISGGESYKRLMNLLVQLRKVCNHPYMFPEAEPGYDGTSTGEDIVEGSGKLKVSIWD